MGANLHQSHMLTDKVGTERVKAVRAMYDVCTALLFSEVCAACECE